MTMVVEKDEYGNDMLPYKYEPAWVRQVIPRKKKSGKAGMTRYEVIVAGKKVAVKYTRTGAALLAEGFNKLMK